MKKTLIALAATGFVVASASTGLACAYHSADAAHNLKLAQSMLSAESPLVVDETGMSTHDAKKPVVETDATSN